MFGGGLIASALCSGGKLVVQDDWQPPDWWIPVPEPEPYEMYFLAEAIDTNKNVSIQLCDPETNYSGYGSLNIDWGDGTIENYLGYPNGQMWDYRISHTYANVGQFLIKITTTEQSCCLKNLNYNSLILIIKLGDNCVITSEAANNSSAFMRLYRLHHISFNGKNGFPSGAFMMCYNLRKVDTKVPCINIPEYCFSECYQLNKFDFSDVETIGNTALGHTAFKKIDLPKCTSIAERGIQYCYELEDISAPVCVSAGESAFSSDYGLANAIFADDCTFGANCFQSCYNLISRPDGSTN